MVHLTTHASYTGDALKNLFPCISLMQPTHPRNRRPPPDRRTHPVAVILIMISNHNHDYSQS